MPSLLKALAEFKEAISNENLTVVHFSEEWAEQCKQIDDLLDLLSKQDEYSSIKFFKILSTDMPEAALQYKVTAVPTVLLFRNDQLVDSIQGVDPKTITQKIMKYKDCGSLEERLKSLINHSKVMLFMKGSKIQPRCGFSRQIVEILEGLGANYETFDILTDEEVRQGLKTYSDWPTYPQLYINGELVGGLDIVREMNSSGELKKMLSA
ncbi:glutaredoxin-3 [Coccinella septempunctata]|uniref:glutaredoxin-3 n=1 Tax=Coccinella septempunctata TaxID=41139 RepID=UPI001D091D2F|nr:glutaredoxin-3 [Coccinella septempunctata]